MSAKKILVICNTFPPAPGIGGRRWAKFSKYLTRMGYDVHVVCATNLSEKISEWNKDIERNPRIHVHPQDFKLRKLFLLSSGLFSRVFRRIMVKVLHHTKYSERFITSLPNSAIWNQVASLVREEKISTVIVSGDPFLFYYAAKLKRQMNYKLILDYRDLWTDHSFYTKYKWFTPSQYKFFEEAETVSLQQCDRVLTVDEHLKDTISKKLPGTQANKISVLHNGFDPEDFAFGPQHAANKKKIIYFSGNLATDLNEIVLHFISSFAKLKQEIPREYHQWEIHLKGKMDEQLYHALAACELENLVLQNDFIPLPQYYKEIAGIDLGMIVLSPEYAHSYTTKFSDYLNLDKKMLVLGAPGGISELLQKNDNGAIFTLEDDHHFFTKLHALLASPVRYDSELKQQFDIAVLTGQLDLILSEN